MRNTVKYLLSILVFFLFVYATSAQTTVVTIQVTDAGGQPWNNGNWTTTLVSPPGVTPYGPPFFLLGTTTPVPNQSQTGSLSGTAGATMTLTQNASITPSQSLWKFSVCPQATAGCFTQYATASGATMTLTITPPAISIQAGATSTAYSDSEVVGFIGQQYFNLTLGQLRVCIAPIAGQCVTWNSSGSLSSVSSLPATCTPGATAPVNLTTPPYGIFWCSAPNTWSQSTGGALTSPITSPTYIQFGTQATPVDVGFSGKNPYVDVRAYGARSVASNGTPVLAGITAIMTAGMATATVSTSSCPSQTGSVCFANGDGVVVYGAGATNTLSTPTAPTVTPSLAQGAMNASNLVNAPTGAITYNYQIVLRDTAGGLTAASAVGTTTTGQATLGAVQVAVTSLTRTNNSVAVVTSSPINLAIGATIYVTNSTDASFSGFQRVNTVTDTTHFTYLQGLDTRGGASVSATGGTVQMYSCNKLTMPAYPTGGWQYYVYGRTGGSLTLIGVTKPLDPVFEDYGSPMMDGITLPSYVPNSPSGAATNDQLSTTIVSGGGTTTLNLANSALNSVTGATIKLDHGPNLLAAIAANLNGYPIYIPSGFNLVINSYTNIGSNVDILQAGLITLFETLVNGTSINWNADNGPSSNPSFGTFPYRTVDIRTANPGIFSTAGGNTRIVGVNFQISKQGTGVIFDDANGTNAGFNQSFDWCAFTVNPGGDGLDYMGMGLISRGDSLNFFRRVKFGVSMPNVYGASLTPLVLMREDLTAANPAGSIYVEDSAFENRAMAWDSYPAGFAYVLIRFTNVYGTGLRMPFIILAAPQGGTLTLDGVQLDTSAVPFVANLTRGNVSAVSVKILAYNLPSGEAAGSAGILSGIPFTSVTTNAQATGGITGSFPVGQNVSLVDDLGNFYNNHVFVNNPGGTMGFTMISPTAPTLSLSAGGSVPPGTWFYGLTALDLNGNETVMGARTSVAVPGTCPGSGTCTVTITPPTAPVGSLQYNSYRSNGGGFAKVFGGPTNWGVNQVDNFATADGPPPLPGATTAGFTSTGTQTQALEFSTTPFASLGTPLNGTMVYCLDCTIANPCAGGGTGAIAKRLNGVWVCN